MADINDYFGLIDRSTGQSLRERVHDNGDGTFSRVVYFVNVSTPVAATFSVPGTVLQTWFNVHDYGAAGDGTTDDAAAIQSAITAAVVAGGTVFFPVGTYLCGSTLNIPVAITMRGAGGWGTSDGVSSHIKAKAGLNANLIAFTPTAPAGVVGAVFKDLVFNGNGVNQTAGSTFYALGAIQCRWDHCHFTNPYNNSLYLYQDGNGGTGHQNRITGCLFDGGTGVNAISGADGRGLLIQASDENVIQGCDFENNGAALSGQPNHLYDRSGLQTIMGNSFVNGTTAIKCEGSGSRIIANIFDGPSAHNVRLNGSQHLVSGNTFYNLGAQGPGANTVSGVYVDNVADALIIGNSIFAAGTGKAKSGIDLTSGTPTNALITGNILSTANGSFGSAAIAIGTGTGHRIYHNRGWNPTGALTAPGIPASGTPYSHTFPYDVTCYVSSGTVSQIAVSGSNTGLTAGSFRLPAGVSITLTYSAAPTWAWIAD